MAAKKSRRPNFTLEEKRKLLAEAKTNGFAATAKKHNTTPSSLYEWQRKGIKPARGFTPSAVEATNGDAAHGEVKQKLAIIGLTPLIRELVVNELKPLLAEELPKAIERALRQGTG